MPSTAKATPKRKLAETLSGLMPKKASASSSLPLRARLARKTELVGRLSSKQQEANRAHQRIASGRVKQHQARDEAMALKATVERERSGNETPRSEGRLKAAEAALRSIGERVSADEHRLLELQGDIDNLRHEIQQLSQGAALEEVQEHLVALTVADEQVARFETLILDAQAAPAPDRSDDQELDTLQQAREDLLADIAAGDTSVDELASLDVQIQEILNDSDGHQARTLGKERDDAQTLAGLKRRLSAVQGQRDSLRQQTPAVIEQLLIGRAEATAQEYLQHAQALQLCHQRMQGIADLLTSAVPGTQVRLLSDQWQGLLIPSAPLHAFDDASHHDAGRGVLFSAREACHRGELKDAGSEQLEQLGAMGLSELFQK